MAQVCSITYARIQGKNAMVAHFQNSSLLHEDKRCRPVLFHSTGSMVRRYATLAVDFEVRPIT